MQFNASLNRTDRASAARGGQGARRRHAESNAAERDASPDVAGL